MFFTKVKTIESFCLMEMKIVNILFEVYQTQNKQSEQCLVHDHEKIRKIMIPMIIIYYFHTDAFARLESFVALKLSNLAMASA